MRILCGTDFSINANHTALAAAGLAKRMQGTLALAHVLDLSRYSNPSKDLVHHLRYSRQNKLVVLAERARRRGAQVETHLVEGVPGTRLAELANELSAPLLVLGSGGPISPSEWYTGSVADLVAQFTSTPVLVIRQPDALEAWAQNGRPLRIVVGFDFSPNSEAALHWAGSLRKLSACDLTVVHVASPTSGCRSALVPAMSPLYYPSGLRLFLQKELEQKCDAILGTNTPGICVQPDWGRPDAQLIETALENRADLVVVGASQRSGLARFGSTSRAVLHYAPMNVACVPFPAHSPKLWRNRSTNGNLGLVADTADLAPNITTAGPDVAEDANNETANTREPAKGPSLLAELT